MKSDEPVRLSVVIPVLNDADGLRRCVRSIRADAACSTPFEVVVVDNGSTDSSRDVASDEGALVLNLPNLRVGELRNRGAARAQGAILAFIDADHEILSGWTAAACSVLTEKGIAGVGAPCLSPPAGTWVQRTYGRMRGQQVGRQDVDWLGSGNLAIKREVFEQLGGFDAGLEVCEDVDFCQRVRDAGWRLCSDERLRNIHYGDPATLCALFKSELWRGKDNLRVSLRRLTLRGFPSILIPIVDLLALVFTAAGLATLPWGGLRVVILSTSAIIALAALRTARILADPGRMTTFAIGQAAAVAVTYDLARALALLFRPKHRRAR